MDDLTTLKGQFRRRLREIEKRIASGNEDADTLAILLARRAKLKELLA